MKAFISLAIVFSGLFGFSVKQYLFQLEHLTKKQKQVMIKTWNKAKEFNLQYTMTSIALKESSFGLQKENDRDGKGNDLGSYGVFHNLVSSVYDRYVKFKPKDKITMWSIKVNLAKRLRDDYDFSFSQCLAELKYWENYAIAEGKGWNKWKLMLMRYNGGTYGNKKKSALLYYEEIVKIAKAIKLYRQKHKGLLR